jgi:hypothetical protein
MTRPRSYTARQMRARPAVALAVALAGALAFSAQASALEPGVHVDPGSPAGKEYSIPLSVLRAEGSGRPATEGVQQPLFGVGIRPAGARGKAAAPSGQPRGGSSGTPPGAGAGGGRGALGRSPAGGVAAGDLTHRGSPTPEVALVGGLVVFGGALLGALLVLARRRLG